MTKCLANSADGRQSALLTATQKNSSQRRTTHGCLLLIPRERLVQQRLFQIVQRGEFAFVDGGEALGFGFKRFQHFNNPFLPINTRQRKDKPFNLLRAQIGLCRAG